MGEIHSLRCRECGAPHPHAAHHVCERCFGPLEVVYDYAALRGTLTHAMIAARPHNLWRYRELLPVTGEPDVGPCSGWTPLVRAERLAAALGVAEVWIKDESVSHPTFSYKDRVVSVAIAQARALGFDTVACASTGNLANAVAAHAARAGLACYLFVPAGLEEGKVLGAGVYAPHLVAVRGSYDDVNRLCSEIGDTYPWAFVNITLRPYYTEGAKTVGFEIAEQLGWRTPDHIVVPTAGGTLLPKIHKAFAELADLGLVAGRAPRIHAAQAAGAAPIIRTLHAGGDEIEPVKPDTIATSIAIGNPADGHDVLQVVRDSGGWGDAASDDELLAGVELLARHEGIFAEPAGGAAVAVTRKLVAAGRIGRRESVVICVTGNGYKTVAALRARLAAPPVIDARLSAFAALVASPAARRAAAPC